MVLQRKTNHLLDIAVVVRNQNLCHRTSSGKSPVFRPILLPGSLGNRVQPVVSHRCDITSRFWQTFVIQAPLYGGVNVNAG
jgi:hypothetical protein